MSQKLKQEGFKDFQALLYKFKDFQGLEFLFSNSRTFKDFQVFYEPWFYPTPSRKTKLCHESHITQAVLQLSSSKKTCLT